MLEKFKKFKKSKLQSEQPEQKQQKTENSEKTKSTFEDVSYFEERPFLGEFPGDEVDEFGEFKEPTKEKKEWFWKRIKRVSEIFENADFPWYLDGAPNISLYGDKQIRAHKDLDISIFKEDLEKLEEFLREKGFGIFLNFEAKGKNLLQRVTAKEITEKINKGENPYLTICKIDPNGKIQKETKDPFNFVDLHIHSKDAEGNVIISYNGITLPKEFFEPIKKKLENGKIINLSQPAIVAYHKLHSNRPYDLFDLKKLRPYLQKKDFQMLRESLEEEIKRTREKTKEKLQEIWNFLTSIIQSTSDPKTMEEKFWQHPEVKKYKSDPKVLEFISSIFQSKNQNLTFEDFLKQSFEILKPSEQFEQKLKFIEELEKLNTK